MIFFAEPTDGCTECRQIQQNILMTSCKNGCLTLMQTVAQSYFISEQGLLNFLNLESVFEKTF